MAAHPSLRAAIAAVVTVGLFASLTGCASAPTVTLAQSKATTQLLRLDTSSKIPADYISEVVRTTDIAEECGDGDPYLRWVSSASARFTSSNSAEVDGVYNELVNNLVERGWESSPVGDGAVTLSSEESIAVVEISQHPETVPASVDIKAVGPCVETAGLSSEEVEKLVKS